MPGKKRLSLKQKGFAKDFVESRNATEAAMKNYNCKNRISAAVTGNHALTSPQVIREIDRIMAEKDITDDFLMGKLREGLDANVVSNFKGDVEETEVPDKYVRHKYLQDALKMKGFLKEQVDVRSLNLDVQLENMTPEELSGILRGMLKQIKQPAENQQNG